MKNFVIILSLVFVVLTSGCVSHSLVYTLNNSGDIKTTIKYHIKNIEFAGSWDSGRSVTRSENANDKDVALQIKKRLLNTYPHIFTASEKKTVPISIVLTRAFDLDKRNSMYSLFEVMVKSRQKSVYSYTFLVQVKCYNEIATTQIKVQYTRTRVVITWFDLFFAGGEKNIGNSPRVINHGDYEFLDANTKELYSAIVNAVANLPEEKIKRSYFSQSVSETNLLQ